jgi:hypothetical protein
VPPLRRKQDATRERSHTSFSPPPAPMPARGCRSSCPRISREGAGLTRPSRHQSAVRLLMRDAARAMQPNLSISSTIRARSRSAIAASTSPSRGLSRSSGRAVGGRASAPLSRGVVGGRDGRVDGGERDLWAPGQRGEFAGERDSVPVAQLAGSGELGLFRARPALAALRSLAVLRRMLAIGRRTEGRGERLVSSAASLTGEQHAGRGECAC